MGVSSSTRCHKCAINKAGKYRCCSRGGAWFNNCSDADETKLDYRDEDIYAYIGFVTSVSDTSTLQVHMGILIYALNTARQRANNHCPDRIPSADYKRCIALVEYTYTFLIDLVVLAGLLVTAHIRKIRSTVPLNQVQLYLLNMY